MVKRKASALEEPVSYEWPTVDYSSSTSTASPESVKAFAQEQRHIVPWSFGAVPYTNSRTRKRYRDGRPDEETIHQHTLAKLFNAQKQIHFEEHHRDDGQTQIPSILHDVNDVMMDDLSQPERNQRSLDSFFGGVSRNAAPVKNAQPITFNFSRMQEDTLEVARCEDCNTVLQASRPNIWGTGVTDVSMDMDLQQDEWSCASCSRRVCDTCAVRGDHRICLECAVPGG